MLYLAFIYHMHQPYYANLLTGETPLPWVRLHGIKDYLDMVDILKDYPAIHQTFNLVPSLIEQLDDLISRTTKDFFWELSYKPASQLTAGEKEFIQENFFSISRDTVISMYPRYYELYFKRLKRIEFIEQDYLDLQVWFNLAWIDPSLRKKSPELQKVLAKERFFSEEEKRLVLDKHLSILEEVIPVYRKFMHSGQIEITPSPFYHPILPLLVNTKTAKEAEPRTVLPKINFSYPQDASEQISRAVAFFKGKFGVPPSGMWPSEESVSEHILTYIMQAGIRWIVTDEALLFKSLRRKKRDTKLLYKPHLLRREEGDLQIIFRDRNLSDLIGFEYNKWPAKEAASDFIKHLVNIDKAFRGQDTLVTIAMDGENAWEYFRNDGHDFLHGLYQQLQEASFLRCVTVSEYLLQHPATSEIKRLSAGSWIFGNFGKWIGNAHKVKAWEYLAKARYELAEITQDSEKRAALGDKLQLALKQMYIAEGSDWFWWYGEDPGGTFDRLFRMHLSNFYTIIGKDIPEYLKKPLTT